MRPFSPDDIRELAAGSSDRKHEVLKIANLVSSHRVDGGSTRLRRFLANIKATGSSIESSQYAAYLSNEVNYLLSHYGNILTIGPIPINHDRIDRAVNTARDWFDRARGLAPAASAVNPNDTRVTPALINTSHSSSPNPRSQPANTPSIGTTGHSLMQDMRSTPAWINNTIFFCQQFQNPRMRRIDSEVMFNLFAAEVGANRTNLEPRKVNSQGYMGPFQMGIAEWKANRNHRLNGALPGCASTLAKAYTKSGRATGPADVVVAPAVWARYISKVINRIPDEVFERSLADAVYCMHNIGPGNFDDLVQFARGSGRLGGRCAWAMFTQLGKADNRDAPFYHNSRAKARGKTPATHRPLRAFMNIMATYNPNFSYTQLIEQMISESMRSSSFRHRIN